MNRVTLVVPNYTLRQEFGEPSAPPIGPTLVAASLRDAGHSVAFVDADAEDLSVEETVERILNSEPDAVGISCNYITKHNPTIQLARRIKQRSNPFVFVGGNHASAYAPTLLEAEGFAIDMVLKGEGEVGAPILMRALSGKDSLENVPGACVLKQRKAIELSPPRHLQDLDALPLPAYDLLPMENYSRYAVVTSRGCPYRCSFCASTCIAGTKVRLRSVASVIQEIETLRRNYGERFIWISDDTFTAVPKHVRNLVSAMADLVPKLQWSCMTSIAAFLEDLLVAMKNAGCEYISIGVESTHPAHKRFIGKPISDESVVSAVAKIHRAGMRVYGFFIIGFPGENRETLEARYRLIEQAGFDGIAANLLIPLPGTALWQELVTNKLLDPCELDMDHLFARMTNEEVSYKTAVLLEKWTELTASELVEGCARCRKIAEASAPGDIVYAPNE